ncbi:unnamed protein product [Aureobasidium pullulans]|nr:unnamed protein product [Aureobasidium pullulans]
MAPGPPPFGYTYHLRLPPNVRPKTNHTVTSDSFEDSTHYTRPPLNLKSWVDHNVNTTPSYEEADGATLALTPTLPLPLA